MKIAIADPQARVRFSLRVLLEQQQGWLVGGEAVDCHELIDLVLEDPQDILLVDLDLPGMRSEDLLHLLRMGCPNMLIIAMSGRQELGQAAMQAGADAFIYKAESPEKLLNLIRERQDQDIKFLTRGVNE